MPIQDWVHRVEEGGGLKYLKHALMVLALAGLVVSYNYRGFRNMSNPEAMDAAQLGRNIAEHQGYTTLFVRPFSIYLLQRTAADRLGPAALGDLSDRGQLRTLHPDLANPPVYPLVLAGLMKLFPACRHQAAGSDHIWNRNGVFWIYAPDFYISLLNQFFFLLSVVFVFFLARRLFDSAVAWTSAALFLGTDFFWRFTISGLSTMLVILIFLALAASLVWLEQRVREAKFGPGALVGAASLVGALVALGTLTRYSFGWLVLPVILFLAIFLGKHRVVTCLVAFATFAVILAPWIFRNYHLSHTPFGTAGYALYETTTFFNDFRLQRSLNPDFNQLRLGHLGYKLVGNLRNIVQAELPTLGGNWVSGFFLVGLLIAFRNPTLSRLRWFLVFCIPVLAIAQALGRTHLSEEYPEINSENLLIILMPLIIIFGVSLFFTLLDQMNLPFQQLRYIVVGGFCAIACLPMLLTFASPHTMAVAYPPYFPPVIQQTSAWMKPDELMMSDVPWAVAWYGQRQCLWLTLNAQEDFYNVYDYQKPIKAVYLTPETMDSRFLSQWVRTSEHSWGSFIIDTITKQELPPYFPLRKMPGHFLPEQMFLTDRERWNDPPAAK